MGVMEKILAIVLIIGVFIVAKGYVKVLINKSNTTEMKQSEFIQLADDFFRLSAIEINQSYNISLYNHQ